MRPWIGHLVTNQNACDDFNAWASEAQINLTQLLKDSVLEGKSDRASALAAEMDVYDKLKKTIAAERREYIAQAQYNENQRRT